MSTTQLGWMLQHIFFSGSERSPQASSFLGIRLWEDCLVVEKVRGAVGAEAGVGSPLLCMEIIMKRKSSKKGWLPHAQADALAWVHLVGDFTPRLRLSTKKFLMAGMKKAPAGSGRRYNVQERAMGDVQRSRLYRTHQQLELYKFTLEGPHQEKGPPRLVYSRDLCRVLVDKDGSGTLYRFFGDHSGLRRPDEVAVGTYEYDLEKRESFTSWRWCPIGKTPDYQIPCKIWDEGVWDLLEPIFGPLPPIIVLQYPDDG